MSLELNIPSDLIRDDNSPVFFQANNRTYFKIPDLTGVYNATTNPTGYGNSQFPTGERTVADITSSRFILTKPHDETNGVPNEYTIELDGTTTPTSIDIADETEELEVTDVTFNGSIGTVQADGIYTGRYEVEFQASILGSFTSGILTTSDNSNWSNHDVAVGSTLRIVYSGLDAYFIVATVTDDELTFTDNTGLVSGTTDYDVFVVYRTLFYVLLTKSSEKCWAESAPKVIGDFCCSECNEQSTLEVTKFATLLDTAKAAYVTENYSKSQEIIDYLVSKCTDNNLCTTCS